MVLLWFRHYFIKQILNLMGLRSDRPANIFLKNAVGICRTGSLEHFTKSVILYYVRPNNINKCVYHNVSIKNV